MIIAALTFGQLSLKTTIDIQLQLSFFFIYIRWKSLSGNRILNIGKHGLYRPNKKTVKDARTQARGTNRQDNSPADLRPEELKSELKLIRLLSFINL